MRRILGNGANVAVALVMLSFTGCDGGGIEEGVPKDLTPGVDINSVKLARRRVPSLPYRRRVQGLRQPRRRPRTERRKPPGGAHCSSLLRC